MQIGGEHTMYPLTIDQQNIEHVNQFTYFGSILTDDGEVTNYKCQHQTAA